MTRQTAETSRPAPTTAQREIGRRRASPDTPSRLTRSRSFTDDHRRRLDRSVTLYLRDCYRASTPARICDLAVYLRCHPDYLSRIGPRIVGMPLRQFLRSKQLDYAAQLLRTTPLDAREIALRAAFGTNSTFYRCFRERFRVTPQQFREGKKCGSPSIAR